MCIIVAKKAGAKFPTDKIIENCWEGNSDGAGIAWVQGNKVKVRKGFMKLASLKRFIKQLQRKVNLDETDVVLHFRITSVGETLAKMTHPFRIDTDDDKRRTLLSMEGKSFVFHNGTITGVKKFEKTYSDTFSFTKGVLQPLYSMNKRFQYDNRCVELIETVINGDKLAFITPEGIKLIGEFVVDKDIYYSNYGYEGWGKYYGYGYGGYSYSWRDYYTTPTRSDYTKAVTKVKDALQDVYCDYTLEEIEAFSKKYEDEIDTILDWETNNPLDDDNEHLRYELDMLGV